MGMRIPAGLGSGLIAPDTVDKLVEAQKIPVEQAKKRRELVVKEKEEVNKLNTFLTELESILNGLKSRADFYKLKVESSHPDIVDGTVTSLAMPGSYEFEVRGLAKAEKELAYGFPDKDKTQVGFGYMTVEREDQEPLEVTIDPGSTLQDIAQKINDANAGVRAMVVNTKYKPEGYRLLVVSEKSGEEAKITLDEDTTFMEFKEQVTGRNLDILFEDVPVTDEDNQLDELLEGVIFQAKRAEPGTRVQVSIVYDVDATLEQIKGFVEKYNQIAGFVHDQFVIDEETQRAGILAADGTIKQVMRSLQGTLQLPATEAKKFATLAQIGIITNPKDGTLNMDEAKVRNALTEDYEAVAALFVRMNGLPGFADRMADSVKNLRNPNFGAVRSRLRALDNIIKNADQDIERREGTLKQKEEMIRRQFASLEGRLSALQGQGNFLAQRFGGGGGSSQGGGG